MRSSNPVDFKSALQELLARRGAEVGYEVAERGRTAARAHLRGGWRASTERELGSGSGPQQEARRAGGRARWPSSGSAGE